MCSRPCRPVGLPIFVARVPAGPFARCPTRSSLPSRLCLDHSHYLVLAPATLAALPSTRAILKLVCFPAHSPLPIAALPSMLLFPNAPFDRVCSMSLIPHFPCVHLQLLNS